MSPRIVGDLSHLPTAGFRSHGLWWWAGAGFMLIEGAGFLLAFAAYVYLMNGSTQWPLDAPPPDLLWGTLGTAVFLASLVPNAWASNAARRRDLPAARRLAVAMTAIGAAILAIRALEFTHLNSRWDQDAYGSVTWALILIHSVHLITDFLDTFFLTVFLFTHPVDTERFSDVDDNAGYWAYIVVFWLPTYLLIYWAPRWAP
ncbi:heme-copper oxidase subunit III [Phenylobacterium sp.]|uniref:cytochrome c oxidase subunit 3 n=1 Tax=Phenylobacterium sp. TaxID=1871053 RepID=UPI0035AE9098